MNNEQRERTVHRLMFIVLTKLASLTRPLLKDKSVLVIPTSVDLYQEGDLGSLNLKELGQYLGEKTSIPFSLCGDIFEGLIEEKINRVADQFSRIKVIDPRRRWIPREPLQGEIDYERRRIKNPGWRVFGNLYEGVFYQKIISDLVLGNRLDLRHCTLLFTNQLFGTWDRVDQRYHARVSLYGFPHLISISGLVEAPAKPKEFYLKKQRGIPLERLKEEYQGRFLDYGDQRMTEVLKGYAMQALFLHLTGSPFCEDRDCRLFNSHWQEEVIRSQLNGKYEFCPKHEAILERLRSNSGRYDRQG